MNFTRFESGISEGCVEVTIGLGLMVDFFCGCNGVCSFGFLFVFTGTDCVIGVPIIDVPLGFCVTTTVFSFCSVSVIDNWLVAENL